MLRNNASGPEIGLPGWILAGLLAGRHRSRPSSRPKAGRRADFGSFPVAVRPKSSPEGRFPAREHYRCLRNKRPSKPCEFIGFGAMDVTKPYKLIRFGAIAITKPYKFIGFGAKAVGQPWLLRSEAGRLPEVGPLPAKCGGAARNLKANANAMVR